MKRCLQCKQRRYARNEKFCNRDCYKMYRRTHKPIKKPTFLDSLEAKGREFQEYLLRQEGV